MGKYIVHYNGYFFEWSEVVDAPVTFGMSRGEFEEYYRETYGSSGMQNLPARMERALKFGTSSVTPISVRDMVSGNRAGPDETELSFEDVIRFYCVEKRDPAINEPSI